MTSTMLCMGHDSYVDSNSFIEDTRYLETEFVNFHSDTEAESHGTGCWSIPSASSSSAPGRTSSTGAAAQVSWLIRLGCERLSARSASRSRTTGCRKWLPRTGARHAILDWRLRRPYLLYCLAVAATTAFLLLWNLIKGVQNEWNLPMWKHHRWEEVLEVSIGVLIVTETVVTLGMLGCRVFFSSCWCVFDFCVALLTIVSIAYGLEHLGRQGEICEANVPLLLSRFVLQPARVLAMAANSYRAQQMQAGVDELQVNFDCLSSNGFMFEPLQELGG